MKEKEKDIGSLKNKHSILKFVFTLLIQCTAMCITHHCFAQSAENNNTWIIRQQPLHLVLDSIEQRYQVSFNYDFDRISQIVVSNSLIWDASIESTCDRIFESTPLIYSSSDSQHFQLFSKEEAISSDQSMISVIDAETKQPIPFTAISYNDGTGVETDTSGIFYLPVNKSKPLLIQRLGYAPLTISSDSLRMLGSIQLNPTPTELASVEISNEKPGVQLQNGAGAIQVESKQFHTNNTSVFTNDPLRSIQLLPGIQAHDDLSSEIKIRGGDGDESLIILDGMTLYEAKHYYGIFSTINADVVDQISVYKNHTPPHIEGRTSGVVDISTFPSSNQNKSFFDAQLGLMNASLNTLVSLKKGMSLMAGIRSTTGNPGQSQFQSLLNPKPGERQRDREVSTVNVISEIPDYSFYDWNLKWAWQLNEKNQLSFSTFHSHDETQLNYSHAFKLSNSSAAITLFEENYNEEGTWNNDAYQIRYDRELSKRVQLSNRLVLSKSGTSSFLDSEFFRRVSSDSTLSGGYSNLISNQISDLHYFSSLSVKGNNQTNKPENSFETGIDLQVVDNQFGVEYGNQKQFNQQQKATTLSLFAAKKLYLNKQFVVDLSSRISHYSPTQKLYLSPQASLHWTIKDGKYIKGSFSLPAQMMQRAYFEDLTGREYTFWVNANGLKIPVSRGKKMMVGYQQVNQNFKWDVEFYYKKTDGVIELSSNQLGFSSINFGVNSNTTLRIFDGSSKTIGMDWLGIYQKGPFTSQLSYTLSKTDQQFDEILRGKWFTSREDSRHQIKFSNSLKAGKFTFNSLWIFASGRPYTDISKLVEQQQERPNTNPNDIQSRLPDYHRIDLSLSYSIKQKSSEIYMNIAVLNILNRRNVKYTQFIFGQKDIGSTPTTNVAGTEWGLLDRTLNMSIGVRF